MERLRYTVKTPEETLDDELLAMYHGEPGVYLASDECEDSRLYWGGARSIGELAICRGKDKYGRMQFEGLRNKLGIDILWIEIHEDDDTQFGTFTPIVGLEFAPKHPTSKEEVMQWILDQKIAMLAQRLEWLAHLPTQLRAARVYDKLLTEDLRELEDATRVKNEGFSKTSAPTFKQIMEAKQKQLADASGVTN